MRKQEQCDGILTIGEIIYIFLLFIGKNSLKSVNILTFGAICGRGKLGLLLDIVWSGGQEVELFS